MNRLEELQNERVNKLCEFDDLHAGDPRRKEKRRELFELSKQIVAERTGDPTILNKSAEDITGGIGQDRYPGTGN